MSILKKLSRDDVYIVLEQLHKFDWSLQDEAFALDTVKQFEGLKWKAPRKTADKAKTKNLLDQRKRVASSTFPWPGQQDELNRLDSDIRRMTSSPRRRNPQAR
jgi:hypothetical protein